MPKTENTAGMSAILDPLARFLKSQGFRKTGGNFNRAVEDGLIQVLTFQMGRYEFGAREIPGIRHNLHGKFTVNIGILIPNILRLEGFGKIDAKKVYNAAYCSISTRLGHVSPYAGDAWWSIQEPFPPISAEVQDLLKNYGLPFLDQFRRNKDIIDRFEQDRRLPGITDPGCRKIIGILYHAAGNHQAATAAFNEARSLVEKDHPFIQHVNLIESRIGELEGR